MTENDTFEKNIVLSSRTWLLVLVCLLIKIPMFLTEHIQEDSFITWRVARNLLEHGVIGFNGAERISASTTHLYVIISAIMQMVFGEYFIYPQLIFNSIAFALGSVLLASVLFYDRVRRSWFVILLNLTPAALTVSCLGMEYGILFFLFCAFIRYGIVEHRRWAFFVFPILLLWTRIDTVIFLGIFFIADVFYRKKINFIYIIGGVIGLVSVVLFNYFYFGEWVNHTITAKQIAYQGSPNKGFYPFLVQLSYYGGLLRMAGTLSIILFLAFTVFLLLICFKVLQELKINKNTKMIFFAMVVYALSQLFVFVLFNANFDWYYWMPRTFMFSAVLFFVIEVLRGPFKLKIAGIALFMLGLCTLQVLQSYAVSYMESTQRLAISNDLKVRRPNSSQSIMLEPAGKIPFYTRLYTIDEVGLVDKRVNDEMLKDRKYWWINSVKRFQPQYILTIGVKPGEGSYYEMKPDGRAYFNEHYRFVKSYPISEVRKSAPEVLKKIYAIRPIGKDYYLYEKRVE